MTRKEYEEYVQSRLSDYVTPEYCVIAINEEAGEIAGWWKKAVLRGNPTGKYTDDDLKGECGDALFYLTALIRKKGWTLDEVMEFNRAKLDKRVADGKRIVA